MRRITGGVVVWLVALWVLLWNDVSVANVVSGVVLAVVVLGLSRLVSASSAEPGTGDRPRISPPHLVFFIGYVLVQLVRSNVFLAWEILTRRNTVHTGIIAVPMRTNSDVAMMVMANVITMTPGTVTIDAKDSPAVLYVNVLHLHDVDRIRNDLRRLEEVCVRAFGSRTARAQLARGGSLT